MAMKPHPHHPLPIFTPTATSSISPLNFVSLTKSLQLRPINSSVKPPPPDFDFRSSFEFFSNTCSTVSENHPDLIDLANSGSLILIEKRQFGPVPKWRDEFVEPEEIWLIGTTHISQVSAGDVERVIRTLRPDNVVVELCRSRAGIMYISNDDDKNLKSSMFSLSGSEFFGAVGRSINLGGETALALRVLLAAFASKLSSDAGRPFGDEFRAARKVSEQIGAQIVLGDRPIEITLGLDIVNVFQLEKAWKSLNWSEKFSLVSSVLRGIAASSDASMNNLKDTSVNESPGQLYEQLSLSYPSLLQPLIHERDTYLAWSLKRSKAVNNCKRVVGVIGKGHLNGVIYALVSDQGDLRFRDLAGYKRPEDNWVNRLLKNLVRDTIIGALLWALYEQIKSGF